MRNVAADDLDAPLGQASNTVPARLPLAPATAAAIALGIPVAIFLGWVVVRDDPLGGEPTATVAINRNTAPAPASDGRSSLPA